jgi:DNA-binding NarL/FixJ family response regulator
VGTVVIRVLMVEDHPIAQTGLAHIVADLPDMELGGVFERIEDMPRGGPLPDVVLLDLHLPGSLQGLAAVRYLTDRGLRVLVVTADDMGMDEVADAIAAGACGYLTKHAPAGEYASAIRAVAAGHVYIGARLAAHARRASRALAEDSPNRLTKREEEIAGLVVDGYTNAEIGRVLCLSERTVDGHLESIKRKIHETRRVRVAMRLKDLGYQPPPELSLGQDR